MLRAFVRPSASRVRWRTFLRDRRGVSAVEFGLLLPLMLTMYFGGVELSQALTAYRKVNHLSSVAGDLVAQSTVLSSTDMNNIFDASKAVMSPFNGSTARIVIGYINIDSKGDAKVTWSAARGRSAYALNQPPPVPLPAGLNTPNTTVVIAEAEYDYQTSFAAMVRDIIGSDSIKLKAKSFFRPRSSSPITYSG